MNDLDEYIDLDIVEWDGVVDVVDGRPERVDCRSGRRHVTR